MKPPKVLNNNGYCLLRFTVDSVRYSLTLGRYDNLEDRRKAALISSRISHDVQNGLFTGDVAVYKNESELVSKARIIAMIEVWPYKHGAPIKQGLLKHLRNYKGEIKNKYQAQKFIDSLEVSTASKRRYYTALRSITNFKEIFDCEIKRPKDEPIKDIDPFTENEVKAILEALKDSLYYPYFAFLAYTGCRPSEALALEWSDLSLSQGIARITKALDSKGNVKSTKNGKSRTVPLSGNLIEILLENRNSFPDMDCVFPKKPSKATIRHIWRLAIKRSGVRYRPLYNLRHSFITQCLVKGVPVATVALWCGNSPEVIYRHYAGSLGNMTLPEIY